MSIVDTSCIQILDRQVLHLIEFKIIKLTSVVSILSMNEVWTGGCFHTVDGKQER